MKDARKKVSQKKATGMPLGVYVVFVPWADLYLSLLWCGLHVVDWPSKYKNAQNAIRVCQFVVRILNPQLSKPHFHLDMDIEIRIHIFVSLAIRRIRILYIRHSCSVGLRANTNKQPSNRFVEGATASAGQVENHAFCTYAKSIAPCDISIIPSSHIL